MVFWISSKEEWRWCPVILDYAQLRSSFLLVSTNFYAIDILCLIGHNLNVKIKERLVEYFRTPGGKLPAQEWLHSIKDKMTQAILYKRIRQAGLGNFGDHKSVGDGVQELRINYGPGFRIYYGIHEDEVILLLIGGSKKTQTADIEKAKTYWIIFKENQNG